MNTSHVLQNSNDLLHALQDAAKEPLILRAGDNDHPAIYELEWTETRPTFANISGTNLPYSQVWLHGKPFPVAIFSKWNNVKVVPQGDFAAFNLDFAASATFTDVWVVSRAAKGQTHYHKKDWSQVNHEGVGWELTPRNTGDSSYDLNLIRCRMSYGRIGFDIQKAGVKGTVKLTLDNCIFDSNEVGIKAFNAGEMRIDGGNIQLSKTALWFDHCSNVQVEFLNIERCELDALLTPDCHEITFMNSRITTITDPGRRARWGKRQLHRNVDSYNRPTKPKAPKAKAAKRK